MSTTRDSESVESGSGGVRSLPVDARIHAVRKRDGRLVPFDLSKISAAIAKAMQAVNESDDGFAMEVAGVVELALNSRHNSGTGAVPSIEEVQDCVENVLVELGRAKVAKAYILYRDMRTRSRDALKVSHPAGGRRNTGDPAVRVQESEGTSPWSKGRIVAALMGEANLPREVASDVAARVEERVFHSGRRRISTGLIRELVDNELMDMGLTRALRRQAALGLPRHDFMRILAGEALTPWEHESFAELRPGVAPNYVSGPRALEVSTTRAVCSEIVRRYALEDVLSDGLAELHLAGDLSVEDLGAAQLPLWIGVPSELILGGQPDAGGAFQLLDELADAARGASVGVVLEDPAAALAPLLRATRPGSSTGLSAWLAALRAMARASGRHIDLGSIGIKSRGFLARLVLEMAAEVPSVFAPRLFVTNEELAGLLPSPNNTVEGALEIEAATNALLAAGRLVPTWSGERQFAAPGCRRGPRERGVLACGGAVALNLPRLARRSGAWRENRMLEELASLVQAALEAARSITAFQRRARHGGHGGFARMRTSFALAPVGLAEALFVLGDGRIDPDQGARLLGFLSEAAHRYSRPGDPEIVVSSLFGERAAARLAWLDAANMRGGHELGTIDQHALFEEALLEGGGDPFPRAPYSRGYTLGSASGWWPGEAEARLLSPLPSGALYPFPRLADELSGGEAHASLATWRRFARAQDLALGSAGEPGLFTLIPGGFPKEKPTAPTDTES